jgi:hypothetical protein
MDKRRSNINREQQCVAGGKKMKNSLKTDDKAYQTQPVSLDSDITSINMSYLQQRVLHATNYTSTENQKPIPRHYNKDTRKIVR